MNYKLCSHILFVFSTFFLLSCSSEISNIKTNEEKVEIKISKYLILGNSITLHPVVNYWWGEWGMAATSRDADYVHVLNKMLQQNTGKTIPYKAYSIVKWEFDTSYDKTQFDSYFDGDEDMVILRIGENIRSQYYGVYQKEFEALVDYIKLKSPFARIIITGVFWTNSTVDQIQYAVAKKKGCIWVDLNKFDTAENKATLDTKVYGEDGTLHTIREGGDPEPASTVARHPGDKGMKNIATAIFNAMKN